MFSRERALHGQTVHAYLCAILAGAPPLQPVAPDGGGLFQDDPTHNPGRPLVPGGGAWTPPAAGAPPRSAWAIDAHRSLALVLYPVARNAKGFTFGFPAPRYGAGLPCRYDAYPDPRYGGQPGAAGFFAGRGGAITFPRR